MSESFWSSYCKHLLKLDVKFWNMSFRNGIILLSCSYHSEPEKLTTVWSNDDNEWMNEWINGWLWMNKWMAINEEMNDCDWINEWLSMNKWMTVNE